MHHSQNQKYNRLQRNALELIVLLASAFRPQEKSLISEWAEKNRVVSREESSRPGAWDNSLMPFIVQPMNDFVDPEVEQISVMAPAQLFKTELIKNVIAYTIDAAPCPVMYVGPTEKYCLDFSREKLAPMIAANRCLREKVGTEKHRKSASTTNKQFIGGSIAVAWSNSATELSGKSIKIVLMDDADRMSYDVAGEGDSAKLAIERTESYALLGRKIGMFSTPTIKGKSRIEKNYEQSSQHEYHVPCPYCGEFQTLKFENLKWEKKPSDLLGHDHDHLPETTKYQCTGCSELIEEKHKEHMLANGVWIAKYPDRKKHRGYHINRLYSPLSTWVQTVEKFLNSKDDMETLKVFYNTVLAKTFEIKETEEVNIAKLLDRCEDYMTSAKPWIPNGVLVLTAAVDVQGNRLECEVKGWGIDEESWAVSYQIFEGNPNKDDVWRDCFDFIENTSFLREDGVELKIKRYFVDSGDGKYTERIYEQVGPKFPNGWCIKGGRGEKPLLPYHMTKVHRGRVRLLTLGVNNGKSQLHQNLKIAEPGPRYCHFTREINDLNYFKQLTSERLIGKYGPRGVSYTWEPKKKGIRNEAWDLSVYNLACIKQLAPPFLRLEKKYNEEAARIAEEKIKKPEFKPDVQRTRTKQKVRRTTGNFSQWNSW